MSRRGKKRASSTTAAPPPPSSSTSSASPSAGAGSSPSTSPTPTPSSSSLTDPPRAEAVELGLASGEYRAAPKATTSRRRSECWDGFDVVVVAETGVDVGWARCKSCLQVMRSRHGTNSLNKHLKDVCNATRVQSITRGVGVDGDAAGAAQGGQPTADELPHVQAFVTERLTTFVAETMCSMELATSPAMARLLQDFAELGRTAGRIKMKKIMPSATTIKRHLVERVKVARSQVVEKAKEAAAHGRLGATTDMWTDDYRHFHYAAITVHFTTPVFGSENHELLTIKWPVNLKTTGENVWEVLENGLKSIGFTDQEIDNFHWVTDRGANIIKALEGRKRDDCFAHVNNTVLGSTFTISYLHLRKKALLENDEAMRVLQPYVEAAREVKALKGAAQQYGVDAKKLKDCIILPRQALASYGHSLKSVMNQQEKIIRVLQGRQRHDLVAVLQDEHHAAIAAELLGFLMPLEKNGDVPGGDLEKVQAHLRMGDTATGLVQELRAALADDVAVLDILLVVREAKDLVSYLKASGKMLELSSSIPSDCATRWNFLEIMLSALLKTFQQVKAVLTEAQQASRIKFLNEEVLAAIVEFLKPFGKVSKWLQGAEHPTAPLPVIALNLLRKHTADADGDTVAMRALRRRARFLVEEKMEPCLSMRHKVATVLWPPFRQLTNMVTEAEKQEVLAAIRERIGEDADSPDSSPTEPTAAKRNCHGLDEVCSMWLTPEAPLRDELESYLVEAPSNVPKENLLQFWEIESHSTRWPNLAKLALKELGKPASSAASERCFSWAGFIISSRRSRLGADTVDAIIFLHSFYKKINRD